MLPWRRLSASIAEATSRVRSATVERHGLVDMRTVGGTGGGEQQPDGR